MAKDSIKKSLVQGRVGAGVLCLVATVGAFLGWSDVHIVEFQEAIQGGLTAVAALMVTWSKIKEK